MYIDLYIRVGFRFKGSGIRVQDTRFWTIQEVFRRGSSGVSERVGETRGCQSGGARPRTARPLARPSPLS